MMSNILKKTIFWLYLKFHILMRYISISLYNTEVDILKADPNNLNESNKKIQRMRHRNETLEKFYAGHRDEKYVQDYYEILKKADKFIKTATPYKMAVAADKHGSNYGQKDIYGRRYEHYGFFDEKHKHVGKTLAEVLENEYMERRTNDDDYELLYIFNNKPIETGFIKVLDVLEETKKENVDFEYEVVDMFRKSKQFEFPIKVYRDVDVVNKIEQLTEFLHVKKIGFEHRQLEFFIPLKFKTDEIDENSEIFFEIINIKTIFVKDEYGELIGFGVNRFMKKIIHNDTHEVWKFEGIEMEVMSAYKS